MNIRKAEIYDKVWGREEWIVNREEYCGKFLILNRGYYCSVHFHRLKTETFCLLEGLIHFELEDKDALKWEDVFLRPGDVVDIEVGQKHRFTGLAEQSKILEVSTQHFEDDSYRDIKSGKLSDAAIKNLEREQLRYG